MKNFYYTTRTPMPYNNAASINIMQTCETFANNGFKTQLICEYKPWRPTTLFRSIWDYYGIKPCFRIVRLPPGCLTLWARSNIPFRGRANEFLIMTRDFDIALTMAVRGKPCVFEMHHKTVKRDDFERLVNLEACKCIIFITKALKQEYYSNRTNRNKFLVLPDPVDTLKFKPHDACSNQVCGYVGSGFPGKGLWEIVLPLTKKLSHTKFHVAGLTVGRFFKDRQPPQNLILHGHVNFGRITEIYNQFGIALLPNQPSVLLPSGHDIGAYTSPMKLFEYMASGKAIVASDLPVLREILSHEHNALLVPHNDLNAWADAVQRLQLEPATYTKISKQARADAESLYSYRSRFKKLVEAIGYD